MDAPTLREAVATLLGMTGCGCQLDDEEALAWDALSAALSADEARERAVEGLVEALIGMRDCWFDYHDSHSLTQPVTGRAGNAMDRTIEALEAYRAATGGQP